jgi:hypothetical protein
VTPRRRAGVCLHEAAHACALAVSGASGLKSVEVREDGGSAATIANLLLSEDVAAKARLVAPLAEALLGVSARRNLRCSCWPKEAPSSSAPKAPQAVDAGR